jgi:protein tyrosine phosphatase (PTP) superfamily phosphohydrolase (DUF442 family)
MVHAMTRRAMVILVMFAACAFGGCSCKPKPLSVPLAGPIDKPGLHNVFQLTRKLYSGSQPEDEVGFRSLKELGVETILSVDGAVPDVNGAKVHGMRYVHIPIGYDGISTEVAIRIAKAVRDLPGPIYLHCHHGKHRGPAAAAVAVGCLEETVKAEDLVAFLQTAGADPRYTGLYEIVRSARPLSREQLDAVPNNFPEIAEVPDIVRLMVRIDQTWDRLKACEKVGWKPPPEHPDVTPAHEALQLLEHFRETARLPGAENWPPTFRQNRTEAEAAATELERALRTNDGSATIGKAFARNAAACTHCHQSFRDTR